MENARNFFFIGAVLKFYVSVKECVLNTSHPVSPQAGPVIPSFGLEKVRQRPKFGRVNYLRKVQMSQQEGEKTEGANSNN